MKLAISRIRLPRIALRGKRWVALGAVAVACSALVGWHVGGRARAATGEPHATLAKIVHGGAEAGTGVVAVGHDGRRVELTEGSRISWGMRLETSGTTRARVEMDDGTTVAIDRATTLVLDGANTIHLPAGAIVADVASGSLLVATGLGEVRTTDARFAMTADDARTSIEVARGDVDVKGPRDTATVRAGEEGDVARDSGRVEVTATTDLGQRIAFGDRLDVPGDDDGTPAGLGELRARKPGSKDEIDGAVRLARHDVHSHAARMKGEPLGRNGLARAKHRRELRFHRGIGARHDLADAKGPRGAGARLTVPRHSVNSPFGHGLILHETNRCFSCLVRQ